MTTDRLSDLLDLIEVRGIISGGMEVHGHWISESPLDGDLKFFAVVQGSMSVLADGLPEPLRLGAGDVAVLNGRSWVRLVGSSVAGIPVQLDPPASGTFPRVGEGEPEDVIIGGRAEIGAAGRELLLQALPPAALLPAGSAAAPRIRPLLELLFEEVSRQQIGSAFAVRQYGQLLLLHVLRAFAGAADLPPGVLKLMADERLRPALEVMHATPAAPWSLETLAGACAMSRTAFAERFREVAGAPPRAYLNAWRMLVAQRELRSGDARIRPLALELGFSSESSFSTAFKRSVGESPLQYRSRMREASTAS